jgi:hypothetical protein
MEAPLMGKRLRVGWMRANAEAENLFFELDYNLSRHRSRHARTVPSNEAEGIYIPCDFTPQFVGNQFR